MSSGSISIEGIQFVRHKRPSKSTFPIWHHTSPIIQRVQRHMSRVAKQIHVELVGQARFVRISRPRARFVTRYIWVGGVGRKESLVAWDVVRSLRCTSSEGVLQNGHLHSPWWCQVSGVEPVLAMEFLIGALASEGADARRRIAGLVGWSVLTMVDSPRDRIRVVEGVCGGPPVRNVVVAVSGSWLPLPNGLGGVQEVLGL
mmetsp:Transcript_93448/g.204555  ORF Transcript_93448/g.204555 Transcript_93448/m.204555 type:complete len:201 (+) Transcript_93448:56-658(+)